MREALEITLQLATALEAIHAKGSADLDLKPSNIVFRTPPSAVQRAEPVLFDFGISERIGVTPNEISGTLEYMAPEHIAGASPISAAMDSWSRRDPIPDADRPASIQ